MRRKEEGEVFQASVLRRSGQTHHCLDFFVPTKVREIEQGTHLHKQEGCYQEAEEWAIEVERGRG